MEKACWCFPLVVMIGYGLCCVIWPADCAGDFEDEPPADPDAPRPAATLLKTRLTGIGFIVVGLLFLYLMLFGTPDPDPVLI